MATHTEFAPGRQPTQERVVGTVDVVTVRTTGQDSAIAWDGHTERVRAAELHVRVAATAQLPLRQAEVRLSARLVQKVACQAVTLQRTVNEPHGPPRDFRVTAVA